MNRYEDLLESLREKVGNSKLLETLDEIDKEQSGKAGKKDSYVRMPYSSDPVSIDPPWA